MLNVLQGLRDRNRLSMLRVAAVITPGASADTIVDWTVHDEGSERLQEKVAKHWIPVNAEGVLELTGDDNDDLAGSSDVIEHASVSLHSGATDLIGDWSVFCTYGKDDIVAREGAERVQKEIASTQLAALEGGRDCHEKQTVHFAKLVLDYLAQQLGGVEK